MIMLTLEPHLTLLATRAAGVYRLDEPVTYSDGVIEVVVPAGFITDLASIPRWLPGGLSRNTVQPAAIVHDYLYAGPSFPGRPFPEALYRMKRAAADMIFYRAMLAAGTRHWRARLYYRSVRLFGWRGWQRDGMHGG